MKIFESLFVFLMVAGGVFNIIPTLEAQNALSPDIGPPGDQDGNSYIWSTTEVVSTESDKGCIGSSLVAGEDGLLHVVWRDGTNLDWDIFYKNKPIMAILPEGPGSNWSYYEEVSTESTSHSREACLAVDEDGTVHVAWSDYTNYAGSGNDNDIFYKKKPVGGTWSITEVVSTESIDQSYCSSLGVDRDGTIHVVWVDETNFAGSGYDFDIFYKNKTADGNWSMAEVVSVESTEDSRFCSSFVEKDGTVHIAWHDSTDLAGAGSDKDIFYKRRSPDGSWSDIELVSKESTDTAEYPCLAVDRDGTIHVAWEDKTQIPNAGPDYDIFYKKKPGGGSWSTVEIVSIWSNYDSGNCALAVDRRRTVHVAWEEWAGYGGYDIDIHYSQKLRAGSWTYRENISTESDDDSLNPFLAVDRHGTVHVVWEDFTDYMGCGSGRDIFYKKKVRIGNIEVPPGHWLEETPANEVQIQEMD